MSKKDIEIQWAFSPFGHAEFTIFSSDKRMRKAGFEPSCTDAPAVTHYYDDNRIVVLLRKNMGSDEDELISLLVHECVHVWQEIESRMGEKNTSKEFEAYSVQSVFLALLSIYRDGKQ